MSRFAGKLLDVKAAATLLGVTEKTIRARVRRQMIPFRRFGGRIVFLADELDRFLDVLPGVTANQALARVNRDRDEERRRLAEIVDSVVRDLNKTS